MKIYLDFYTNSNLQGKSWNDQRLGNRESIEAVNVLNTAIGQVHRHKINRFINNIHTILKLAFFCCKRPILGGSLQT